MEIDGYHIIRACWIIFVVYWVLQWRRVKATAERQNPVHSLAYRIPTLLGYYLLSVSHRLPGPLGERVIPYGPIPVWTGAALCVLGVLGAIWARKTLADNWSSTVMFKQDHKLIEAGPYHYVRHPIYTALLMMTFGTALASGYLGSFIGFLFSFIGFWIKLKQEENLLLRHFPEEYPVYKTRVKALIPFIL